MRNSFHFIIFFTVSLSFSIPTMAGKKPMLIGADQEIVVAADCEKPPYLIQVLGSGNTVYAKQTKSIDKEECMRKEAAFNSAILAAKEIGGIVEISFSGVINDYIWLRPLTQSGESAELSLNPNLAQFVVQSDCNESKDGKIGFIVVKRNDLPIAYQSSFASKAECVAKSNDTFEQLLVAQREGRMLIKYEDPDLLSFNLSSPHKLVDEYPNTYGSNKPHIPPKNQK